MEVTLRGSSPSTMTAGIMLLTRARQLGFRLDVHVVGDPAELRAVHGPAVLYAPVLASCGVGREFGSGATVVLPGPPGTPLRTTVTPHGVGGWFLVDRAGEGAHPATQAFVRLARDPRVEARHLGKEMRRGMEALGLATDTAVCDVLFGAPVPPLLRLAIGLRCGRAMSGGRGDAITRYLSGGLDTAGEPLSDEMSTDAIIAMVRSGDLNWVFDRLSTAVRDRVETWVQTALALADDDGGRDLDLLAQLALLLSHLAQLPVHSILPPLGAAEDSVAVALRDAMRADGVSDANQELLQMFKFLGGRFVSEARYPLLVDEATPPEDPNDVVAHLEWFGSQVRIGRKRADALWDDIFDPAQ